MSSTTAQEHPVQNPPTGFAARAGRWSANHRKTAILGWLAFVIAAIALGGAVGTHTLTTSEAGVGESGHAARAAAAAFPQSAEENVLIHNAKLAADTPAFEHTTADVARRLQAIPGLRDIRRGPISRDGAAGFTATPLYLGAAAATLRYSARRPACSGRLSRSATTRRSCRPRRRSWR